MRDIYIYKITTLDWCITETFTLL